MFHLFINHYWKWEENGRRWKEHIEDNRREFEWLNEKVNASFARVERHFSALSARWRLHAECSFRDAMAAILEKSFGITVVNLNEFDDEGTVFRRSNQVELGVVIYTGTLILIEIESSVGRADMYVFERQVRFYERRHGRKAQQLIVVSPVIDPRAREIVKWLGIDLYANSEDVPTR